MLKGNHSSYIELDALVPRVYCSDTGITFDCLCADAGAAFAVAGSRCDC